MPRLTPPSIHPSLTERDQMGVKVDPAAVQEATATGARTAYESKSGAVHETLGMEPDDARCACCGDPSTDTGTPAPLVLRLRPIGYNRRSPFEIIAAGRRTGRVF